MINVHVILRNGTVSEATELIAADPPAIMIIDGFVNYYDAISESNNLPTFCDLQDIMDS